MSVLSWIADDISIPSLAALHELALSKFDRNTFISVFMTGIDSLMGAGGTRLPQNFWMLGSMLDEIMEK